MTSLRVTSDEKGILVSTLVEKAFVDEKTKLQIMKNELAEEVYTTFVAPHVKALKLLEGIATQKKSTISLSCSNWYGRYYGDLAKDRLFISGNETMVPSSFDPKKHPTEYNKLQKIIASVDKAVEKENQLHAKITGALTTLNTTKQLSEQWPEAYEEYLKLFPEKSPNVPAIPRRALNTLIGLKTINE